MTYSCLSNFVIPLLLLPKNCEKLTKEKGKIATVCRMSQQFKQNTDKMVHVLHMTISMVSLQVCQDFLENMKIIKLLEQKHLKKRRGQAKRLEAWKNEGISHPVTRTKWWDRRPTENEGSAKMERRLRSITHKNTKGLLVWEGAEFM